MDLRRRTSRDRRGRRAAAKAVSSRSTPILALEVLGDPWSGRTRLKKKVNRIAMTLLSDPMVDGELTIRAIGGGAREGSAACALDRDIWPIYAASYDPEHFDGSFEALVSRPNTKAFAILLGGELVGMSAYLGIEPERGVLEIGNTYYVPHLRGTGFNRRVKDLMPGRAFACGFRRVEFRVDAATPAARRRWRSSARCAKGCCAPTGSPGPAMSATPCSSPSSPASGKAGPD